MVSIQNSVNGTTNITAGEFTAGSTTFATLAVTVGAGNGAFTVTINSVVSPTIAVISLTRRWFPGLNRLTRLS